VDRRPSPTTLWPEFNATIKRFVAKPSDRAAVVRQLAESVGGSLESYYWMFGQYEVRSSLSRHCTDEDHAETP